MLQLFFIRHGETEWNVEKRLQGRKNSALTENGVRDAKLLGERLASTDFEAVISSPSMRTVETAKLVMGERTLPFKTDERLMEIDLGEWEGRTVEEIKESEPELFYVYEENPAQFQGTGETFQDVKNRLESVLIDLEKEYPSGNLLIVTHGVVVKVLQTICKKNSLDFVWGPPFIEGTSLTLVKIEDGKRELLLEGDISHKENARI